MAKGGKEHSITYSIFGRKDKSVDQSIRDTQSSLSSLERVGAGVFDAVATAAGIAASTIGAVGGYAVSVGASFEEQMSAVEAISGASAAQMDTLNEKALQVSATSAFTASDVGKAYEYMSMAGWDAQQQLEGVESVMNLAAASGEELGMVSDIVTDQITAFGLSAADAAEFSDVLAAASSNSNTNVSMMGETFKYAGAVAGSLGYSIQDVALATGLMANSSIKASQAGTSLRKIMSSLTADVVLTGKAFAKAGEEEGEYDVKVVNDDGSMKSFKEIMDSLREGFSQLTESEKSANAEALVGVNAMTGLLTIVNASEKDYKKLKKAIDESEGATQRMADIRLDNLNGDVTLLQSQMEALGIGIYEKINAPLRESVQGFTATMGELGTEFIDSGSIERWIGNLERAVPIAVESFQEIHEIFAPFTAVAKSFGEFLLDNPDVFVSTLTGIGSAMVTYKIARNVMGVASAIKGFIALSNPLSAALTVAGVAIGVIAGVSTQLSLMEKQARQEDLAKHFGNVSLSMKEVQAVAQEIVSSNSLGKLQESIGNLQEVDKAKDKLDDITSELDKMNWKVSVGLELTEEERSTYKDQIESYVDTMQKMVEDHQYSVSVSMETLLDKSKNKDTILKDLNNFYASNRSELSKLGKELSKTVSDAFSDNLLDFDEIKKISEVQSKMATIQSGITTSNFNGKLEVLAMEFEENGFTAESFQKVAEQINEDIANAEEIFKESLELDIAALDGVYEYGSDEYESAVEDLRAGTNKKVLDLKERSAQFLMNQVEKAYGGTVTSFNGERSNELNDVLGDKLENTLGAIPFEHYYNDLESLDKYNISMKNVDNILSIISPIISDVYLEYDSLKNSGKKIPKSLKSTGELIKKYQSFSNADRADSNSTIEYLNEFFNTNIGLYNRLMDRNERADPNHQFDFLSKNIKVDENELEQKATDSFNIAQRIFQTTYKDGIALEIPVNITGNPKVDFRDRNVFDYSKTPESTGNHRKAPRDPGNLNRNAALKHAEGGIFNTPHFGVFAEAGPEAFIPIRDKERGTQVWLETGEMLGLLNSDSTPSYNAGSSVGKLSTYHQGLLDDLDKVANETINQTTNQSITFSPTVTIQGNASKSETQQALQFTFEKFKEWFAECEYQKKRTSLG